MFTLGYISGSFLLICLGRTMHWPSHDGLPLRASSDLSPRLIVYDSFRVTGDLPRPLPMITSRDLLAPQRFLPTSSLSSSFWSLMIALVRSINLHCLWSLMKAPLLSSQLPSSPLVIDDRPCSLSTSFVSSGR